MTKISEKLYCVKLVDYTANPDLTFELLSSLESYFMSYEDRESVGILKKFAAENYGEE